MSNAIEVAGVWKRYRLRGRSIGGMVKDGWRSWRHPSAADESGLWALKDVSFEVARGSAFALVGANGSGKSTMLKLVSGMMPPSRGRLAINGRFALLTHLGGGFHPELTGRENIFLQGAILGFGRKELKRRLEAMLAFAELERFADVAVKFYSSGMALRLGFAVAVHVDPEILLIDEALAVGDSSFHDRCLARLMEFRSTGTTLVMVSHERYLIEQLCDRAVLFDHGQLAAQGRPDEVFASYERISESPDESQGALVVEGELANAPFAFERLELVGYAAGTQPVITPDQPLTIRMAVRATRDMTDGTVGVNITREWHILHGTRCSRQGIVLSVKAGDLVELEVTYRSINLGRGGYSVNLLLYEHRLAEQPTATIKRIARFKVDHPESDGVGLVALAHQWKRLE
ncbi:MAG: ABC transporter ATP-binding protein [Gemmatimonadota bacterium]